MSTENSPIDAGDHWLFIGQVEKFDDKAKAALCYHKGGYAMLSPHPGTRKVDESQPLTNHEGKLNNNIFYLTDIPHLKSIF